MVQVMELNTCPCRPEFTYKKTKLHQTWEANQVHKHAKVRSKEFENEIERLKRRLTHKEAVEVELLNRIHGLEKDVVYWKGVSDVLYVN